MFHAQIIFKHLQKIVFFKPDIFLQPSDGWEKNVYTLFVKEKLPGEFSYKLFLYTREKKVFHVLLMQGFNIKMI